MSIVNSRSAVAFAAVLISSYAIAGETPTEIKCGDSQAILGYLSLRAQTQTSMDSQYRPTCPLLKNRKLLKVLSTFAPGTTFAYPAFPYTCLSGTILRGTLRLGTRHEFNIDPVASYSESAQRLLPIPDGQGQGPVNLFAVSVDSSLQAGAAMTAIHLKGTDSKGTVMELDLLLNDHFVISPAADGKIDDTEDFLIVGSQGTFNASGRLTGRGQVFSQTPLGIDFDIAGTVCLQ